MELIMRNHYERAHGEQLNARMREAFGFEFTLWFQNNQWRENYECYCIMDGGEMLSNVGVYKTPLLIAGKRVEALQIGAVATRKDQQGKGFVRQIMQHIQSKYPGTPQFLHANQTVTQFYPRFGFRRVMEHTACIARAIDNPGLKAVKLNLDDPRLETLLYARGAYSNVLDCQDTQTVQVFHQIMDYGDCNYYFEDLDALVIAEQNGDVLTVADVVAKSQVSFDALASRLPFCGVARVEFGFCPDWLGVAPDWTPIADDDRALFVLGDLPLPEYFHIPDTSIT